MPKTYKIINPRSACILNSQDRRSTTFIRNPVIAAIVDTAEEYIYGSARNYARRNHFLIDVNMIDFGVEDGYIMT